MIIPMTRMFDSKQAKGRALKKPFTLQAPPLRALPANTTALLLHRQQLIPLLLSTESAAASLHLESWVMLYSTQCQATGNIIEILYYQATGNIKNKIKNNGPVPKADS